MPLRYRVPANARDIQLPSPEPVCPICGEPVGLETAKTDETGVAIHEACYLLMLELKEDTSESQEKDSKYPSHPHWFCTE
jgi:hypothetical protein